MKRTALLVRRASSLQFEEELLMGYNVRYSIIIPMFNEEAVIQETYRRIKK